MTAQPASTVDVLKAAREKLAKPEAWTKGYFARDMFGTALSYEKPDAVCWCALGATAAVASQSAGPIARPTQLLDRATGGSIVTFNDRKSTTHPMILAMFDKAIALAEGEV